MHAECGEDARHLSHLLRRAHPDRAVALGRDTVDAAQALRIGAAAGQVVLVHGGRDVDQGGVGRHLLAVHRRQPAGEVGPQLPQVLEGHDGGSFRKIGAGYRDGIR